MEFTRCIPWGNDVQCPVDYVLINENKARVTAFFVLAPSIIFLVTGLWIIPAFLVIDLFFRLKNWGKYSLLAILSGVVIEQLKIKNKPTDRGPKRFAAGVGVVFAAAILVFSLFQLGTAAIFLDLVLVIFACLESFFGFCAGCHVYSLLGLKDTYLKIN